MAGRRSLGSPELATNICTDIFYFGCSFCLSESGGTGWGLAQALLVLEKGTLRMLALEEAALSKSSLLH